jgi:hypothetical protein
MGIRSDRLSTKSILSSEGDGGSSPPKVVTESDIASLARAPYAWASAVALG